MNLIAFLLHNRHEVTELALEHLFLVAVSTGIAILIGVPLGILLTRKPALSKPVIGIANMLQTVPSLALFGFLIPIPFIGGIGSLAPERRSDMARLGVRAMIGGLLATYLTATIAGVLL